MHRHAAVYCGCSIVVVEPVGDNVALYKKKKFHFSNCHVFIGLVLAEALLVNLLCYASECLSSLLVMPPCYALCVFLSGT